MAMLLNAVVDCAGSDTAMVVVSFVLTQRDKGELYQRYHAASFLLSLLQQLLSKQKE